MKKVIIALLLSFFVATLFSSCKSHDCPAYSQVDTEQVDINS